MKYIFDKLSSLNLMVVLTVITLLLFIGIALTMVVLKVAPESLYRFTPIAVLLMFALYHTVSKLRSWKRQ